MGDTPRNNASRPRVKASDSPQFTGPIPIGRNRYGATASYTFSEIVTCDWLSTGGYWQRDMLVIERSGNLAFPFQSVKHIHLIAWLCAVTDYSTEDGGWALDSWEAHAEADKDKRDTINVTLHMAVRGEGARLNRVGYMWTAFVAEPIEQ